MYKQSVQTAIPKPQKDSDYLRDLEDEEVEWMLQIAYLYLQLERFESAQCILDALLEFKPNNVDALLNLCYVKIQMGNLKNATTLASQLTNIQLEKRYELVLNRLQKMISQHEAEKLRDAQAAAEQEASTEQILETTT